MALAGIGAPIGLSFALGGIAKATPLQSFAAGAALCSTSLGTIFTVLGTTGLLETRLGVVLTSAAMLDDVVGLVMVRVISTLGGSTSDFNAITVIKPVLVSIAFAIVCPLIYWLVLRPTMLKFNELREKNRTGLLHRIMSRPGSIFSLHTTLLISMVVGATYSGTSDLFAAYLAGAIIGWWDIEVPHVTPDATQASQNLEEKKMTTSTLNGKRVSSTMKISRSGRAIYEAYCLPANKRILKPFFFVRSHALISRPGLILGGLHRILGLNYTNV